MKFIFITLKYTNSQHKWRNMLLHLQLPTTLYTLQRDYTWNYSEIHSLHSLEKFGRKGIYTNAITFHIQIFTEELNTQIRIVNCTKFFFFFSSIPQKKKKNYSKWSSLWTKKINHSSIIKKKQNIKLKPRISKKFMYCNISQASK